MNTGNTLEEATTGDTWGAYRLDADGWWRLDPFYLTTFREMFLRWLIAQREWPNLDSRFEEPDGPPNEKLSLRREFERRG